MLRWLIAVALVGLWLSSPIACRLYVPPEGSGPEPTTGESTTGESITESSTGSESVADSGTNTTTDVVPDNGSIEVPTSATALLEYLKQGSYQSWRRESAPHQTQGPHKSGALVFVNDILLTSLEANNANHPKGSIAIKELYEPDLQTKAGWAVMVKTEDASLNGKGWYWFEVFSSARGDQFIADGNGVALCTGCHQPGKDYFLTTFPLQ